MSVSTRTRSKTKKNHNNYLLGNTFKIVQYEGYYYQNDQHGLFIELREYFDKLIVTDTNGKSNRKISVDSVEKEDIEIFGKSEIDHKDSEPSTSKIDEIKEEKTINFDKDEDFDIFEPIFVINNLPFDQLCKLQLFFEAKNYYFFQYSYNDDDADTVIVVIAVPRKHFQILDWKILPYSETCIFNNSDDIFDEEDDILEDDDVLEDKENNDNLKNSSWWNLFPVEYFPGFAVVRGEEEEEEEEDTDYDDDDIDIWNDTFYEYCRDNRGALLVLELCHKKSNNVFPLGVHNIEFDSNVSNEVTLWQLHMASQLLGIFTNDSEDNIENKSILLCNFDNTRDCEDYFNYLTSNKRFTDFRNWMVKYGFDAVRPKVLSDTISRKMAASRNDEDLHWDRLFTSSNHFWAKFMTYTVDDYDKDENIIKIHNSFKHSNFKFSNIPQHSLIFKLEAAITIN